MIIAPCAFVVSRQWAEDLYSLNLIAIFFPSALSMRIIIFDRANWMSIGFTRLILLKHEPKSKIIINGIKIMAVKHPSSYSSRLSTYSLQPILPLFPHPRGPQSIRIICYTFSPWIPIVTQIIIVHSAALFGGSRSSPPSCLGSWQSPPGWPAPAPHRGR